MTGRRDLNIGGKLVGGFETFEFEADGETVLLVEEQNSRIQVVDLSPDCLSRKRGMGWCWTRELLDAIDEAWEASIASGLSRPVFARGERLALADCGQQRKSLDKAVEGDSQ